MKRTVSALLAAVMCFTILTGCGGAERTSDEGKILNIYCWNEEFKSRMTDHYPGYVPIDATTGSIGDVTVKWNITPSENNAYQNNLDNALLKQEKNKADERVDLFLMEADYALKYVNTDYVLPVSELGITENDVANQYDYTKDIVTDSQGRMKGISWQSCPGGVIYNRAIAKEVFGFDDPEKVQEKLKDWETFRQTAKELRKAGYYITASVNDTYRVYSNNVTHKWVEDNKIVIDENLVKWVEDSKALVDAKETNTYAMWSDDWSRGFYPEGKVFCYFGPAWFIDFSMAADTEGSIANAGGWGLAEGPQSFYWGGTWICGATGTDNAGLVKDIMLKMTTDEAILRDIVLQDNDFVNHRLVMEEFASDASYQNAVLGGQNPVPVLSVGAEKVDLSNLSGYDQGCNEEFQNAMKNYFEGQGSLSETLDLFYKAVEEKYPELAH